MGSVTPLAEGVCDPDRKLQRTGNSQSAEPWDLRVENLAVLQ
jgi:hypothetical protein